MAKDKATPAAQEGTKKAQESPASTNATNSGGSNQELLQKCESSGVKGIDWGSLLQQYGPALLQILLQILQKNQTLEARQGVGASADTTKVQCGEDDLKCLDECIDNCCKTLCNLVEHRCKCEPKAS